MVIAMRCEILRSPLKNMLSTFLNKKRKMQVVGNRLDADFVDGLSQSLQVKHNHSLVLPNKIMIVN